MAWRVDEVDFVFVFVFVGVTNGTVFGSDGDATFAFEVAGVENQVVLAACEFIEVFCAEHARLIEHLVGQGGFTVVDVSDDCDVT